MGQFIDKKIDFLGKGITFPIKLNSRGAIVKAKPVELITASIGNIISTTLGTRFYLGEFGERLEDLLEEPNSDVLERTLPLLLKDQILKWEKRVEYVNIKSSVVGMAKLRLDISYKIIGSPNEESFIWPFKNTEVTT